MKIWRTGNFPTDSVLSFMSSPVGQEVVNRYFTYVKRSKNRTPNYSDMLATLDLDRCTTKEEVSLGSSFVDRGVITSYLEEVFSL